MKASLSASFEDADAIPDTRLEVAYVGPFLLRHAASLDDTATVHHLLRHLPSLLHRLPLADSATLPPPRLQPPPFKKGGEEEEEEEKPIWMRLLAREIYQKIYK
ncbi:hypothetical protein COCNU_scaffold013088G000010 [Cocos nucifera]|nr:hypothetical protein [Cocos nucifera]